MIYFNSCTGPSSLPDPVVSVTNHTQMSIKWSKPKDDGGCAVNSYEVHMDDGDNGDLKKIDD